MDIKDNFKIIVAGGRYFEDYNLLKKKLDIALSNIVDNFNIVIISGEARGADTLGEKYARENNYDIEVHSADWDNLGKRAGYVRNSEMAKSVLDNGYGGLVAFWDGKSKGTKMMIELAQKKNINTRVIFY